MKYNLINTETKEETLCDKINIDGYDYYVGDIGCKIGWFYCYRTKTLFKDEGLDVNCCNSDINVLATNNPNINIQKAIEIFPITPEEHHLFEDINNDEVVNVIVYTKQNPIDWLYLQYEIYGYLTPQMVEKAKQLA